MLMMPLALIGCVGSNETTVLDRARPLSAECAETLAGDSIAAARMGCLPLLVTLEAGAGWQ